MPDTLTKPANPRTDAPDVIITTKVSSMCYACRKAIAQGEEAIWRRTHGCRHHDCDHPEPV